MAKQKATEKTESCKKTTAPKSVSTPEKSIKKTIRQTDLPKVSLEDALKVPMAIWDQYAGGATQPIFVAQAIGISPSSSNWRVLSGAAIAYGLTEGGYNSKEISLTELGRRIVAPISENDDKLALFQAAQLPQYFKKFYEKYGNGSKLPQENIAANILTSWGVPKPDAKDAFDLIRRNGEYCGLIVTIHGNQYVNAMPPKSTTEAEEKLTTSIENGEEDVIVPDIVLESLDIAVDKNEESPKTDIANNKVFISHGKNKKVVEQLKQLLEFGAYDPVVSVERETTAISVPDKVFNDMKMCNAGVIHIEGERKLLDTEGQEHSLINENVLIEIGAAIALFNKKVILLCKKGTTLPSNLQGLYRCEYEGEQLDYESTMKLLKTFSEFRKN